MNRKQVLTTGASGMGLECVRALGARRCAALLGFKPAARVAPHWLARASMHSMLDHQLLRPKPEQAVTRAA